jgi:hypothetical protein
MTWMLTCTSGYLRGSILCPDGRWCAPLSWSWSGQIHCDGGELGVASCSACWRWCPHPPGDLDSGSHLSLFGTTGVDTLPYLEWFQTRSNIMAHQILDYPWSPFFVRLFLGTQKKLDSTPDLALFQGSFLCQTLAWDTEETWWHARSCAVADLLNCQTQKLLGTQET